MKASCMCLALSTLLLAHTAGAADHQVTARGSNTFSPASLTIDVGDTVTFVNGGGIHNVVSDPDAVTQFRCANGCDGDGAGGNGDPSGAAWSATVLFDTPGTIGYICEFHGSSMAGTITVVGAPPPTFSLSTDDQYLWMVPPASNEDQQGFLRLMNNENVAADVSVWGLDAAGERSTGTITLTLAANESRQFNSQDLEAGNSGKGLSGSLGDGEGDWSVIVGSDSDIEALTFIRTPDGFLTSMHERVVGDGLNWFVPMFNPAQNPNQVSRLRIINTEASAVDVIIDGVDDAGVDGDSPVALQIPALESVELSSVDLENGNAGMGLSGALGDGSGKWRLNVIASGRLTVQSLLFDPAGYLTNLSSIPDQSELSSGERVLWLVPPASNEQQQGFVRITNRSFSSGVVTVSGVDDAGQPSAGSITFTLQGRASQQFNSQDIEFGNTDKGLSGSFGDGSGDWRVHVESDLDFVQMAYIRTPDGFLTAMHDVVASSDGLTTVVPMFNPAQNPNQVSELRLINPGVTDALISIVGRDDPGLMGPGGAVTLTLPAGQAIALSSTDIEQGNAGKGLTGAIGDGSGKWVLTVTSSVPIKAMSLLRDPRGYLTNLSNVARGGSGELDP